MADDLTEALLPLTRRDFVKTGFAGASVVFFAKPLAAAEALFQPSARTLVVVQMVGGNDALNTFIPYTDSRYRDARPTLSIPDSKILQIDSTLGFHPSMTG